MNANQLARERASKLLNQLTAGAVVAGMAGVFGFGALAAATNSGKPATTSVSSTAAAQVRGTTATGGITRRGGRVLGGSPGSGQVSTGGS